MPALIGPIGSVVNMNQAVNGNAAGNPVYISQLNVAESAALGGVAALIASYNSQLASSASATLATTVLNNMFVTTAAGVPAANVTALTTALTQAFDAYPTAKGQVISNLSNLLGNLESDANWGPAARAFNNQAAANYTYSVNAANTNSGTPSSSTVTTYTLTTNADGPGAIAPATNTTGTSGNDTYNGVVTDAAGTTTLNTFDNLAGGTGTDTLNIRVAIGATNNDTTVTPEMSSIENVFATVVSAAGNTGAAIINLVSATGGPSTVGLLNSSSLRLTSFESVAAGSTLALNNGDGTLNAAILGAASRTGTTDAVSLSISNGSGPTGADAANRAVISIGTTAGVRDNTFEVLNITTAGAFSRVASNIGTADGTNSVTTVNVSGTGTASAAGYALDLSAEAGATFRNVTSISASGLTGTGGLYIRTDNNTGNLTFTGSANNDRLDLGLVSNLTSGDTITFGSGFDILGISTATGGGGAHSAVSAAQKALIVATGAEGLAFTNANFAGDSLASYGSALTTFIVSTAHTATDANIAFTNVASTHTIRLDADITAVTPGAGNNAASGIALTGAAVGTTPTLTLNGGIDILGGLANGAGRAGGDGVSFGGSITTLNIVSNTASNTTLNTIIGGAGQQSAGAGNTGGAGGSGIANGVAVQSVVITGAQDLQILGGAGGAANGGTAGAAGAGFSSAVSLNASAFTGRLETSGSNAQDVITLGSGGAIIRTVATAGTGDGDSITLGGGRDQIELTFNSSNRAANAAANMDTVTGFTAGTDRFVVATVPTNTVQQGATYTAVGTGTLTTDLASAVAAGAAATGVAFAQNSIAIVTITGTGAGTFLLQNLANDNTYDAAADIVVRLVGTSGTISLSDFGTAFLT